VSNRLKNELIVKIVELRQQGLSFSEIAKKLGLSKATVWRYYKKWEEEQQQREQQKQAVETSQEFSQPDIVQKQIQEVLSRFESTQTYILQEMSKLRDEVQHLSNIVHGTLEHLKTVDKNLDQVLAKLSELDTFRKLLVQVARMRIEGPTRCKYIDEYGYCEKVLLEYCPPDMQCLEVITEMGIKLYKPKVILNPIICVACPYYTPRKK